MTAGLLRPASSLRSTISNRRRIAQFQIEAPPANWNGVFTAEEK
jgi:hypothetical protein